MELADDLTSQRGGWLMLSEDGASWAFRALSSSDLRVQTEGQWQVDI